MGHQANSQNTTGSGNTVLGSTALYSNTTLSNNTAVGYQAGYTSTTGTITAVGYRALFTSNTAGIGNTAVGYQAAQSSTTGAVDAFGTNTLYSNTTGSNNAAFGNSTLSANTTGSNNAAFGGFPCLYNNTTGSNNVAMGNGALNANTTASDNTAIGYRAGYSNTTGAGLTLLGKDAGYAATGNYNTIVGWRTGEAVTSGTDNTIIGALSGLLSTGSQNTFIGGPISGVSNGTATVMTTGSKNCIIGRFTGNQGGLDIRTASNYIVLSDGDGNPLISTADNQTVALEGAVPNSGTGITFPATQSASSNANTLDDYEEGTFTPVITASSGSLTYSTQAGKYTKIGNTVICTFWIQWSANGLSGNTVMGGLPFSSASGGQRPSPSIRTIGFTVTGIIGGWIPNGASYIQINVFNNGGANDVSSASLSAGGEFGGTAVYQV
jgi:hypothetical protein